MEEICSAKSRCGSIIKPRLRAEGAGETVELSLSLRDGLALDGLADGADCNNRASVIATVANVVKITI